MILLIFVFVYKKDIIDIKFFKKYVNIRRPNPKSSGLDIHKIRQGQQRIPITKLAIQDNPITVRT